MKNDKIMLTKDTQIALLLKLLESKHIISKKYVSYLSFDFIREINSIAKNKKYKWAIAWKSQEEQKLYRL